MADSKISGLVAATTIDPTDLLVFVDVSAAGTIDPAFPGRGPAGTTKQLPAADFTLDASQVTTGLLAVARGGLGAGAITGIVKGSGTAYAAAVAGTDYLAPAGNGSGLTGLTTSIVAEGSNLYYTSGRADARVAAAIGVTVQAWDADLDGLAGLATTGFVKRAGAGTFTAAALATGDIPDLSATYSVVAGNTSLVTLGTVTTGTWAATTIAVNHGGTGQTSYTDGQLLIGNTATGGLSKATLTAGTNVTITNGNGTVTIAATAGAGGYATVQEEGSGLTARTVLNFVGAAVTAADDVANSRTNVTVSALVPSNNLSDLANAGTARTNLGLGSLATLSTVTLTSNVTGVLPEANGGTNQSTYTIGDILYASAANTLSKLAGNISTTRKFLRQVGAGASSAAPAWDTLVAGDIPDLSATYQPLDSDLTAIAALTPTKGKLLVGNGTAWTTLAVGTDTNVLTADSAQTLGVKWAAGGGGGGSPGGSTTQVQYNNSGAFAGAANVTISANACLNLASQSNASPADGDLFYGSTQKALHARINGMDHRFVGCLFSQTADGTVTGTTEATVTASGVGTLTLPANFLVPGKTLEFEARGTMDTGATSDNLTLRLYLGATVLLSAAGAYSTNQTGKSWWFKGIVTCRTTGASGTVYSQGDAARYTGTNAAQTNTQLNSSATVTVDTTASLAVDVRATFASSGNTLKCTNLILKALN